MRFHHPVGRACQAPFRGRHVALLAVVMMAIAAIGAVPVATAKSKVAIDSFEAGVLQDLNQTRAEHGLGPLKLSMRLTTAANAHSLDMTSNGYFDHSSHDGTPFWKRVDQTYGSSGYRYWSVGENILWSSPSLTPGRAVALWMASPGHRANILSTEWREIGIAAVHVGSARGVYHGLPVTVITTDFGVRR
jgi:uncharacterized protein YkwD